MTRKMWLIEAEIMPKQGVNDPQGDAVQGGLDALGFPGVDRVRCGKIIRIRVAAASDEAARAMGVAMCDKLLANPVIEDYSLSVAAVEERADR